MNNFWKNKKVVVTGAGGFIGTYMVKALVRQGSFVKACISKGRERVDKTASVEWMPIDIMNHSECKNVLKGQDAVLHFAAMDGGIAFKREHHTEIFRTNTQMALNILDAAKDAHLERVLMMSSIEVYPPTNLSLLYEDMGLTGMVKEDISGYAWSKRFVEIISGLYYREHHLPVAIARLGNVYGPGDSLKRHRVIPTFIECVSKGLPITILNRQIKIAFLSIHDLIRTLLDLTEKYAVGDPVNIVGEQEVRLPELVSMIGHLLGQIPDVHIEKNTNHTKQPVFSTQKAKKILNFHEDMSLENGLEEVIADSIKKKM